jgi:polyphosphate kinase
MRTARLYTDLSYLTADEETTADMDGVFNHLAKPEPPPQIAQVAAGTVSPAAPHGGEN